MTIFTPKGLGAWMLVLLLMMSCAPQTRTGRPEGPPTPPSTKGGKSLVPVITRGGPLKGPARPSRIAAVIEAAARGSAATKAGLTMDGPERELRAALAKAKDAEVSRQGNLVTVRLRGEAGFASNSVAVGQGLYAASERLATVLNRYPGTVVRVEGHTDSQGSEAHNLDLSQRRAAAVANLLEQLGLGPSRLEAAGLGESEPVAESDGESGRRLNRRLEIKVAPSP